MRPVKETFEKNKSRGYILYLTCITAGICPPPHPLKKIVSRSTFLFALVDVRHIQYLMHYGVAMISRLLEKYRSLLQKRPVFFRSLLIVATPYMRASTHKTWMKDSIIK